MTKPNRKTRRGRTQRPRYTSRAARGPAIWKIALGGLAALAVASALFLWKPWPAPTEGQLSLVVQLDSNTISPAPADFSELADAAKSMAASGGGELTVHIGAGDRPSVAYTHSLTVLRDGRPEADPRLRGEAIDAIVTDALAAVESATYTGIGQSLDGLLWSFADDRPAEGMPWVGTAYSSSLPVVDPVDIRELMKGEPAAVVALLPPSSIPDLTGLQLTWVIAGSTGTQSPLNVATAQWRLAFLTAYIEATHAELVSIRESNRQGAALPGTPAGVPVDNLADPTPNLPEPPKPEQAYVVTFDNPATFAPDTDQLLTDASVLRPELDALAAAWATGNYSSIRCYGRVAGFSASPGLPEDIALSLARARVITTWLKTEYSIDANAVGLGQDSPLPGDPRGAHQRSVICEATPITTH
ncbi:MAG: hypothetical protein KF761_07105 [Salinibacterium sp.]|nr:hypothetical protein [Salinibacterium sp.]